jgi:hypothetical protein
LLLLRLQHGKQLPNKDLGRLVLQANDCFFGAIVFATQYDSPWQASSFFRLNFKRLSLGWRLVSSALPAP